MATGSTIDLPATVGRYRVQRLLGRGSFAVVVLAWDEELESSVALKILHTRNKETETRFLEEARMQRRVQSLNVIAVHDIGCLDDGTPYFVLDCASRGTLEDRLDKGIRSPLLEPEGHIQLLSFIDGLADGLSAIHTAGLIHRDIKPANVLFCSAGQEMIEDNQLTCAEPAELPGNHQLLARGERVLVGDLGIAKDLSKSGDSTTLLGGTPFYLAPEQRLRDQVITPAADTYSSTALLWKTLTNETPPRSSELESKLNQIPQCCVHHGLRKVFMKGLEACAANRYQTADEWRWAFHELLGAGSSTVVYRVGKNSGGDPSTDICPYKGLAAYEEGDSRFFRGRDAMVHQLTRRLQLESVLVVGGPSGSGKSSLVQAGLVPALKASASLGGEPLQCLVMTPGPKPMQALHECLEPCGGLAQVLRRVENKDHDPNLVLVVDQFEEIFTLAEPSAKQEFLDTLSKLTKPDSTNIKITLAVRADFYAECARVPWLAAKITKNQVLVGPLTPGELREAIEEPAREAGYVLEKGLVSSIIQEAGNDSGSLPLVAHALVETWIRRTDNTLTLDGFKDSGGVAGAISQSADATFDHQLNDSGREATRRLMLKLVNPGEGTPDTRRIVDREDVLNLTAHGVDESITADVIQKLTAARLLTVDDSKIQIAHEALLRNWPRLRQWIEDSRHDLRMRRKISLHAEEWLAEGKETDLLYHGTPLYASLEWREQNQDQLGALENTFLDDSKRQQEDREEHDAIGRRRTRRLRSVAITLLTVFALGATISSVLAYRAFRDSQQNARIAEEANVQANYRFAGALGAAAYGHFAEDPRASLVIASEAMARSSAADQAQSSTLDTRAAMVAARQVLANAGPFVLGSPIVAGDAMSIALNPQGTILAVGNLDGEIVLLDVQTHQQLQTGSRDHAGGVRDLEFSPDGTSFVSAGADGRLLLWQPDNTGEWRSELLGQTGDVMPDVDFHPSGQYVVSGNHDATVRLWYIDGRSQQPEPLTSGKADVNTLAISSDGDFIVAGNADKTISGWDMRSGELVMEPIDGVHSSHLLDIVFSPTADSFFTMTTDGEAKRVSFPEGEVLDTLFESKEPVGALLMNSTKGELISGNAKGQLVSWSIQSRAIEQRSASGHSQIVKHASMTPDERLIATLGRDQLIRFWTINDLYPMGQQLQSDKQAIKSVAISPDGNLMATGDIDGNITLRQLDSNDTPKIIAGHKGQVWALAFSSDGLLLASADRLGQVQVRDVMRRRVVQMINTGSDAIWSVEFANSKELLVASDIVVSRYSVDEGKLLESLEASESPITRLVLSPDKSRLIITYADGRVAVENVSGTAGTQIIDVGDDLIWSAAINHTGNLLAVASSDETVSLFNILTGSRIAKLTGHRGGATNVAFLGDGLTLVVSDRRGSIHWWDIQSGRRLAAPWPGHKKAVWRMALHPDGKRFATAGDDGKVWIWDALSVDRACQIAYASFDAGQKKQYLGDDHTMQACQ